VARLTITLSDARYRALKETAALPRWYVYLLTRPKRGNSFFLEETVRTLVETKALDGPPGRYRLTQPVQAIQARPASK